MAPMKNVRSPSWNTVSASRRYARETAYDDENPAPGVHAAPIADGVEPTRQ